MELGGWWKTKNLWDWMHSPSSLSIACVVGKTDFCSSPLCSVKHGVGIRFIGRHLALSVSFWVACNILVAFCIFIVPSCCAHAWSRKEKKHVGKSDKVSYDVLGPIFYKLPIITEIGTEISFIFSRKEYKNSIQGYKIQICLENVPFPLGLALKSFAVVTIRF